MKMMILVFGAVLAVCNVANAGVIFSIQSDSKQENLLGPTTGSIDVFAKVTAPDLSQNWVGFQANIAKSGFTGSITAADVTFGPVSNAVSFTQLMTLGTPPGVEAGNVGAQGASAGTPIFDNAGLFRISYSVAAGKTGSFDLSFVGSASQVPTQYFLAPTGTDFTPTFQGGTVSITAVPEPASLLLVSSSVVGLALLRRRRRK